jgi:hypothetical protein
MVSAVWFFKPFETNRKTTSWDFSQYGAKAKISPTVILPNEGKARDGDCAEGKMGVFGFRPSFFMIVDVVVVRDG